MAKRPIATACALGWTMTYVDFAGKWKKSSMREVRKTLFVSMDEGVDNHFYLRINLSFIYHKNLYSMALISCWNDVKM